MSNRMAQEKRKRWTKPTSGDEAVARASPIDDGPCGKDEQIDALCRDLTAKCFVAVTYRKADTYTAKEAGVMDGADTSTKCDANKILVII